MDECGCGPYLRSRDGRRLRRQLRRRGLEGVQRASDAPEGAGTFGRFGGTTRPSGLGLDRGGGGGTGRLRELRGLYSRKGFRACHASDLVYLIQDMEHLGDRICMAATVYHHACADAMHVISGVYVL